MDFQDLISTEFASKVIGGLFLAFFALLFIQSGMEKALDWKGNVAWLTGHFSKSILAGMVPVLLGILMAMELVFGLCNLVGLPLLLLELKNFSALLFITMLGNCLTLLALFFGQRMAKDYVGAAGITAYFILAILGTMYFMLMLPSH